VSFRNLLSWEMWDLAHDPKLEKGVIYMASLNTQEPACWIMLGMLAAQRLDKNLTIAAFEGAIRLGSPQSSILQAQIDLLRAHITEAGSHNPVFLILPIVLFASIAIIALLILKARFKRNRALQS